MANKQKPKFDKTAYDRSYMDQHLTRISVYLNKVTDADILDKLKNIGNVSGYIKALIRKDISDDQ